jgi:hypothetical protein
VGGGLRIGDDDEVVDVMEEDEVVVVANAGRQVEDEEVV